MFQAKHLVAMAALIIAGLAACNSSYYKAMETVGIEKRDIMIDRVEDARDAQGDAAEQFASALDQFRSVVEINGGELEDVYDRLNREYERSLSRSEEVTDRINSVESVADDLFDEWAEELEEYSSPTLRADSKALMNDTRGRYQQLMAAMRKAEASMPPVLEAFQDQVLVLKHNLNAQAIGSLKSELSNIERDTDTLIAEMQKAIAEADEFISSMK